LFENNFFICFWYFLGCLQIQEYVEAATFCSFCKSGTLLKLDEINNTLLPLSDPSLQPLQINILDYLLGVNFFPTFFAI
jgi:predicted translin family RNA/ssDNA-binding protein